MEKHEKKKKRMLYLNDKLFSIRLLEQNKLLNKRTGLVFKCRHGTKRLSNLPPD